MNVEEYQDVEYGTYSNPDLSKRQYLALQSILDCVKTIENDPLLGVVDYDVSAKEHYAEVDGKDIETRLGFLVTATIGDMSYSREYGYLLE